VDGLKVCLTNPMATIIATRSEAGSYSCLNASLCICAKGAWNANFEAKMDLGSLRSRKAWTLSLIAVYQELGCIIERFAWRQPCSHRICRSSVSITASLELNTTLSQLIHEVFFQVLKNLLMHSQQTREQFSPCRRTFCHLVTWHSTQTP
jgi:hypothetical protein